MKFLHLSDLHFHRDENDNQEIHHNLNYIRKHYPNHHVIVTGDITDDGHPGQYENAFKALKAFKGRISICPGNHDFGAAGNFYSRERALRFDEELSTPLDQGGTFSGDNTPVVNVLRDGEDTVMLIALDTNLETVEFWDFACGEVGESQLASLSTIICDPGTATLTKFLFFHHHPFIHGDPFMQLKDAETLMRTIYLKVDVVLFGHKHVSKEWSYANNRMRYLAADNTPGKDYAREVTVHQGEIDVQDVKIQ